MKISVVIPAHNEEEYIGETLKSILAQDYRDYEVIVVDNASTDKTVEICKQFPSVKVVREDKKGLLAARECGRRHATGELIANIDADCRPSTDWLSHGARLFITSNIVAVTGPYDYFDGGLFFKTFSINIQRLVYQPTSIILQFFNMGAVLIGGNNMIRASALNKIGGYNTAILFYGEDTDTAKRIARVGTIIFNDSLEMRTSARRFQSQGFVYTGYMYMFNFVWVTFFWNPYKKFKVNAKNLFTRKF